MRIVFMGTPGFAVPSLERLAESKHELLAAVSQPDRKTGRGLKVKATAVHECAERLNLPVFQPENIRTPEFLSLLQELSPDVICVAAYGKILPKPILDLPTFGCINVHASLLPKYRGAAPIQWSIINGERETGVTIMEMNEGLDTGNIVKQKSIDILDDDDAISVSDMLSVVGADLLVWCLDQIEAVGRINSTAQNEDEATLAPLLKKEDGHINFNTNPDQIICRMMGMKPWPSTFAVHKKEVFKMNKAQSFYPEEAETFLEKDQKPGEVIDLIKDRGPVIRTKDSCICITEIQPPNRKPMEGKDAINGGYVKVGMQFE